MCRSCYFQLWQVRQVRRSLSMDSLQTLAGSFIHVQTRLLLIVCCGITVGPLGCRLSGCRTPLVCAYYNSAPGHVFAPSCLSVAFKISFLVWKCLHEIASSYLVDLVRLVIGVMGRQQTEACCPFVKLVKRSADAAAPSTAQGGGKVCLWIYDFAWQLGVRHCDSDKLRATTG